MNAALADRPEMTSDSPSPDRTNDGAPDVVIMPGSQARPRHGRWWAIVAMVVVIGGGGAVWHWYPEIVAQVKHLRGETASGYAKAQWRRPIKRGFLRTDYFAASLPRLGPQVTRW